MLKNLSQILLEWLKHGLMRISTRQKWVLMVIQHIERTERKLKRLEVVVLYCM